MKTIRTFTTSEIHNLDYTYHNLYGGMAILNKYTGNYHTTIFSYNNKGDTVFRKEIAYDSTSAGVPYFMLGSVRGDIDHLGNRTVYGQLSDISWPSSKWFELKMDSMGNVLSNTYWNESPWAFSNVSTFTRLLSKSNHVYYFIGEDSLVNNTFNPFTGNWVTVHKVKRQIIKKSSNGAFQWKLEGVQSDTTNNSASQKVGRFISPIETYGDKIAYIESDSAFSGGNKLILIDPISSGQFTVPITNYIQSAGFNSYVQYGFATRDSCINLVGFRSNVLNSADQRGFMIKLNAAGQLIDSVNFGSMFLEGAIETTNKKIWATYFAITGTNSYVRGIIEFDNGFNILNVHPEQSIERYNSIITANSIGGCHMGNYASSNGYTGIHDIEMCNYDSLFNTYPNKLTGQVYKDNNKNCNADAVDENLSSRQVTCTDAQNKSYYGYSNASGMYRVRIPNGTFTVSHDPGLYKTQMCPAGTIAINANVSNSIISQHYFDTIVPNINDLKLTLFSDPIWYNSCSYLTAYCQNIGTSTLNATLKLIKDPGLTYSLTLPQANQINGDTAIFYLNNLKPDSVSFVYLNVAPGGAPGPGTPVLFKGILTSTNPEISPGNNVDSLSSLYYGNLKPASNTVMISSSNNISVNKPEFIQGDEELLFKIKFQNTSGSTVQKVLIVDSLGPYLDPSTLKIIKASHTHSFEVNSNGKMLVWLNTPGLTDSSHNEGTSKGYLAYTIKPKSSWPLNKKLYNHADIYFGSFYLKVTNTTVNRKIPNAVGIAEAYKNLTSSRVYIYPNPANEKVYLMAESETTFEMVQIFSMAGEKLVQYIFSQKIEEMELDLNSFSNGIYLIQLQTNKGPLTKKLVVNRNGL